MAAAPAKKRGKDNGSVYSLVSCSDLTPGSLDIWLDLPDSIKFDPQLAPFHKKYEQQRGKLSSPSENERDKTIFEKEIKKITNSNGEIHHEAALRLMEPLQDEDYNKKIQPGRKITVANTLRIIKLTGLVASWVLLTVVLLLNPENEDVVLHTAVIGGQVKEYILPISGEKIKVLVTLTGPFDQSTDNDTYNLMHLWLHRYQDGNYQQNSSRWSIRLPKTEELDFSPSATESKTLILENIGNLNSSYGNNTNFGKEFSEIEATNGTKVSLHLTADGPITVPITLTYQLDPIGYEEGLIIASILLVILYFLIIFEVVNRTLSALLVSTICVCALAWGGARPALKHLVQWLDVETLLLLLSMMLLVAMLAQTGLFDYLAVLAFEKTGGRTWPLINCLCLFTAVFSTFLDNVTTVLLMTPVTIRLCEVMELNPVPILMAMVIFSNVGGAATPVGDPPNVIIATHPAILKENINFTSFTLHMGVGIILVSIQTYFQLRYMYRDINTLRHTVPKDIQEMRQEIAVWRRAAASLSSYSRDEDIVRRALEKKVDKLNAALTKREAKGGPSKSDPMFCATLANMKQKYRIRDKPLLIKSVICVSFVVIVFFLHAIPELQSLSLGWTALLGALLLLLLAEQPDLEPILARVEWSTLLFFAALFVLMEGLSKLGLIDWIGSFTESLILKVGEESRLAVALMLILWVSGLASAFVDNIPLTTMMIRVVVSLSSPRALNLPLAPLAWALSFGACLGDNIPLTTMMIRVVVSLSSPRALNLPLAPLAWACVRGNGTLIGASANVVCAGVAEQHGYRFTFLQFLKTGFPIMIGNLIVASIYLLLCHCVLEWH